MRSSMQSSGTHSIGRRLRFRWSVSVPSACPNIAGEAPGVWPCSGVLSSGMSGGETWGVERSRGARCAARASGPSWSARCGALPSALALFGAVCSLVRPALDEPDRNDCEEGWNDVRAKMHRCTLLKLDMITQKAHGVYCIACSAAAARLFHVCSAHRHASPPLKRFTLGETPPEFGPVEVSQQSETHVEVRRASHVCPCTLALPGDIISGGRGVLRKPSAVWSSGC